MTMKASINLAKVLAKKSTVAKEGPGGQMRLTD